MQISAQALKLTRQLNRAGIAPLFLKGTARLLTADDKKLGFRKQLDIDLLVEPTQLEAACELFLADGYSFSRIPENSTVQPVVLQEAVRRHEGPVSAGLLDACRCHRQHCDSPAEFTTHALTPPESAKYVRRVTS